MSQILSRTARILIDGTIVGAMKNVRQRISNDTIKDYDLDGQDPSVLEYGNYSYELTWERGYINETYAQRIKNGEKVTVVTRPDGAGTGKEEYTYNSCVFRDLETRWERNAVQLVSGTIEAKNLAIANQ